MFIYFIHYTCFVPCVYYVVKMTSGRMSKSSSGPQVSSTPMGTSRVEEFYVNLENEIKESNELKKVKMLIWKLVNPLLSLDSLHRKKLRLKTLSKILRDQEDQKFGMIFLNLK